jgi:adenosylhomocysteine nucleosidase
MTGKILVLTAIDDELDKARAPDGVEVIYSGAGKVNASSAATLALLVLRPSMVINYGTAGSVNEALSGLVEVAHVVQRDMIAMPLVPRGRTPYSSNLDKLSSGFAGVTGGTGDYFDASGDPWLGENHIDLIDMELFAIAHVCQRHTIPWRAFKFIAEDADHWTDDVGKGQDLFWDAVKNLKAVD